MPNFVPDDYFLRTFVEPMLAMPSPPDKLIFCGYTGEDMRVCQCSQCVRVREAFSE